MLSWSGRWRKSSSAKEPEDLAGGGAAGAAGTLRGGGLADAADLKRGKAGPGRLGGDAGEAAVDDGGDAFDGDGTFGDVGGEDELGLRGRVDGAVLLGGGEVAVEREGEPVSAGRGARIAQWRGGFRRRREGRPGC